MKMKSVIQIYNLHFTVCSLTRYRGLGLPSNLHAYFLLFLHDDIVSLPQPLVPTYGSLETTPAVAYL